jgi:type I restriction enzyme M protein
LKGGKLPQVRKSLIHSLKAQITPLKVLDDFQAAGVFVNWWDGIKYDLKTILTNGWSPTLIPDKYMIAQYFSAEAAELTRLESEISAAETTLEEATEAAQETLEYELDEGESLTAGLMKDKLKNAIDESADAQEAAPFKAALNTMTEAETRRKQAKKQQAATQFDLNIKIALKKFGAEDETLDARRLLAQAEKELAEQEKVEKPENEKAHKKKLNALRGDIKTLTERIAAIERLSDSVGGMVDEAEAQELILKKHHDWVTEQLERYTGSEKREVLQMFENFWVKYSQSLTAISDETQLVSDNLSNYLTSLNYLAK